jgi:hypothetical protein
MPLTDSQVGAVGEQLFCAYAIWTSAGLLEAFRPVVDEDHVDVALRRKDTPGWVAFVQVKTTATRKARFEARTTYPADAVLEDDAFLYALLQLEGPAIERCWLVPSAEFNRLATRGRAGEGHVQLVAWVHTREQDGWSPFQVAPELIGQRLETLIGSLEAGREPSTLAAVTLAPGTGPARARGWDEDSVRQLRAALATGSPATVVALLRERPAEPVLQQAGDGLLQALATGTEGAAEQAGRVASGLRTRGWTGDDELADELEGALGSGPLPALRSVPVTLDDVAEFMAGDVMLQRGAWIDLETGEVRPRLADEGLDRELDAELGEDEDEDPDEARAADPERWLWVENEGSGEGYRDMARFLDTAIPAPLRDRLERALGGRRGAFRRFRDVLADHPREQAAWHRFSEERELGRARAWLAGRGYRPALRERRPGASS